MMYEVMIEDLKKFIEVFWKRDDIDIRNFDCYKGFTYMLMQMYKRPDYQEQKNELMSYMEHPDDDWKYYFVNTIISLMKDDNSISEYDRNALKICKFRSDFNESVWSIKRCHNAFILAGDFSTDIYRNTMKNYKATRKKRVMSKLKSYTDAYEDLYERFELHEEVLNELYKSLGDAKSVHMNEYPVDVIKVYNIKKSTNPLYIYMLWLEYAEDKKTFADKYCRPKRTRRS